jgi:hypothetical protein
MAMTYSTLMLTHVRLTTRLIVPRWLALTRELQKVRQGLKLIQLVSVLGVMLMTAELDLLLLKRRLKLTH